MVVLVALCVSVWKWNSLARWQLEQWLRIRASVSSISSSLGKMKTVRRRRPRFTVRQVSVVTVTEFMVRATVNFGLCLL